MVHAADASREALFQKGLSAYQNKNYAEARDSFQKLLDQDASVGVLHNLALTDLQLDQKPWALALWRKALSMQPSFRPAKVGRDLLESKSQMRPFERDSFALWTHRTLESLSFYETLWVNALLLGLAGWLLIRYYGARRLALDSESPLPPFPTPALLTALLFVGSVFLIGLKLHDMLSPRATVVADRAAVRSLPSEDSVGLFELNGGTEVLLRRQQGGWTQVESSEGSSGWVKNGDIFVTSGVR
jgi:tetratricopeptide (TPR) repeat protein